MDKYRTISRVCQGAGLLSGYGVSVKTYSNMERAAQELSLYRIIQLCLLLKLKPGYVLDDCSDDLLALETLPETVCDAKIQLMLLSRKCSDETAQLLNTIDQLLYSVLESKGQR